MSDVITPTVHMNGSSAEMLHSDYVNAVYALNEAIAAVQQTAPHGRDYYVQDDPDAYVKARAQHLNRLACLNNMLRELETLALATMR